MVNKSKEKIFSFEYSNQNKFFIMTIQVEDTYLPILMVGICKRDVYRRRNIRGKYAHP